MNIYKIGFLEPYVNLRKLKLLDNCINEIEGLESLRVLEELSLEKNKLTGI
jgi:Leucine-rich repeat (LRR) protein